jgi:metal-responsive CopG/Arc/MetJ family transcriptional regulator
MATEKPFLNFVIDQELLDRINEYRYKNKIPSRAEAIRQLLTEALDREEGAG